MHITIISLVFPYPESGILAGIERSVESLALNLIKLGHQVTVFTTFWNGGKKFEIYKEIKIYRLHDLKSIFGKFGSILLFHYLSFGLNVIRKKNLKIILNSDAIILPLAIGFMRFLYLKKIPLISMFQHFEYPKSFEDFLYLPFYDFLAKKQFKRNRNIIVRTSSAKKDLIKYYKIKEKYIKVIADGIDLNVFNPKNKDPEIRKKYGNKILLNVSSFYYRKRIPVLLKAMDLVRKEIPDIILILIGDGPDYNYCFELVSRLHLQNNVEFLGHIHFEELLKYYASSDIFVFPSELEGQGLVLLEAMASGLPVICANKPPMDEIIENYGVTFELNDAKDLSLKIIELLKDSRKLNSLKENCIKHVKKYDGIKTYQEYIEYIKKIKKEIN